MPGDGGAAGCRAARAGPVLVGDDGSEHGRRAVRHAEALSARLDRGLVRMHVEEGDPVEELARAAREQRACAAVAGTRGRGPLLGQLFGSVSTGLVRTAGRPVMLVSAHAREPVYRRRVMTGTGLTILIAYDGSEPARNAITHAGRLFPGAQAVVATVWTSMREAARAARVALPQSMIDDAVHNFDAATEASAAGPRAKAPSSRARRAWRPRRCTLQADRSVAGSLLARADELDAAAVIVGSRGLSAVKSVLLGSVSNAIVHQSRRPVVIVHPADA